MNLLFLHAFPLDGRMWEPELARFGGAAPTLYRQGGRSLDEWAAAALDGVGGDVVAVGTSMGGYAALAAARVAPARVKALVLVGTRADADSPERRAARADTIRLLGESDVEALWERLRPQLFAPSASPEAVARAEELALEQGVDDLVRATEAMRDRPDSSALLRGFEGKVRVVVGDSDPFVSPDHFAELVPPDSLEVVRGGGHLLSLERPDVVARAIETVLR